MGLFGALTTAVTGMRAQSFALENVSGNIANSQTIGFKRIDTGFLDMIPDQQPIKQLAGSVTAFSRQTNSVQGDVQSASIGTFMAVNGDGFFVVAKPASFTDNMPTFDGINRYSRRGDFQTDKNGYLVNGAGYYLMGIPVDATTGNLVGSVPQPLKFQNDFLPAQATSRIEYRANLPDYPFTQEHDAKVPRSELMNPAAFASNPIAGPPQAAKITGQNATILPDLVPSVTGTAVLPGGMVNGSVAGDFSVNGVNVTFAAGATPTQVRDAVNAVVPGVASLSGGRLVLTTDADTPLAIGGSGAAVLAEMGLSVGTTANRNLLTQAKAAPGQTLTFTIGANPPYQITFGTGGGQVSNLAELTAALTGMVPAQASAAGVDANGNISVTAANSSDMITVGTGATAVDAANFGIMVPSALPSNQTVRALDVPTFLRQSIGGQAVTAYDVSGSPVNIQMRWAKVDSADYGGTDTWNLFYQVDSTATGTNPAWRNAGINYTFGANGQMAPAIANVSLTGVTVDGVALDTVQIVHGSGGVTQFADVNGTTKVNLLQQNGFPAGELQSVAVSDKGRVVGSYSNGRTLDLAEITLATFNGTNFLKRVDGGAFEVTDSSGPAIYGASGRIAGSSLEGSNTDIADEFTKLIVTQQAYSSNTKVITTANTMVQDLLNMLR
jgi:flagellar hook protein FlgE